MRESSMVQQFNGSKVQKFKVQG